MTPNILFNEGLPKHGESRTEENTKLVAKATKPGRKLAAVLAKAAEAIAPVKKLIVVKAPVVSKDELRAQLEKAQTTIAALRTKAREATRAAKASAAQIAELEGKVAQLEKKSAAQPKPSTKTSAAEKPIKQRGRKTTEKPDPKVSEKSVDPSLTETETPIDD